MIDTPSNRQYAGKDEDFSSWTPTTEFANCIMTWIAQLVPNSGAAAATNGKPKQTDTDRTQTSYPKAVHGGFYAFKTQAHKTTITKVDA